MKDDKKDVEGLEDVEGLDKAQDTPQDVEGLDKTQDTPQDIEGEKTFTQSEVEEIITKRLAREKRAAEKAVAQAEKLAKMNEEEKQAFELDQLKEELENFKRQASYNGLAKEASKMLLEGGVQVDDQLLQLLVKDDAEGTKDNVESFVGLLNSKVEEGVKKVLAGKSPEVYVNNNNLTKESIMKIKDASERVKLIRENSHLFE